MFSSRTVFIVGAGASAELGLPTGPELLATIRDIVGLGIDDLGRLTGDYELLMAIKAEAQRTGVNLNEFLHASRRIRRAVPVAPSIDNLLDAHQDDREMVAVGKLAIAEAI